MYGELHSFVARKLLLDLSYNQITLIDLNDAELMAKEKFDYATMNTQLNNGVHVVLKGNPFMCDCNAYHLVKYFRDELDPEVKFIVDFDGTDFTCGGNNSLAGELVKTLDLRLLTCEILKCTDNCTCYYRPYDKGLLVHCSEKELLEVPTTMPNNSTIKEIELITNHTELDLSLNHLKDIPTKLGQGYERVTKINLSHNNISKVDFSAFSKNIEEIILDNNSLSTMDTPSIDLLKNSNSLKRLVLTNNPWLCNCEALKFIEFVLSSDKVFYSQNMTCKDGGPLRSKINDLCPSTVEYIGISSIVFLVLGLLIGAIATLYYRYQREIKVWLYAHRMCLWFVTEEELDKDKQYDAFVSYSSLDENFVVDKLVPGLEDGPTKYKLCLHYRDWIVGDFIPNQIARSVEDSRRTVVVLSPNFLESVWGRMEFRAAHSQALSEGRARVIVILYGDIGPTQDLDPELKAYLSMNTYVKWGDPWFWDKLRYALPHPSELSKGMPLISHTGGKRQKRISHNDKLINGTEPTNPSVTTPPADSIIADPLKLIDSKPI